MYGGYTRRVMELQAVVLADPRRLAAERALGYLRPDPTCRLGGGSRYRPEAIAGGTPKPDPSEERGRAFNGARAGHLSRLPQPATLPTTSPPPR
jgi:hypothetical protein